MQLKQLRYEAPGSLKPVSQYPPSRGHVTDWQSETLKCYKINAEYDTDIVTV